MTNPAETFTPEHVRLVANRQVKYRDMMNNGKGRIYKRAYIHCSSRWPCLPNELVDNTPGVNPDALQSHQIMRNSRFHPSRLRTHGKAS